MILGLTLLGAAHFVLAIVALVLGARVLMRRKGTAWHKGQGRWFAGAMVALNVAGLFVHQDTPGYGPFHLLAIVSLGTLAGGIMMARTAGSTRARVLNHAYFMCWAYAGLVTAGIGQAAGALGAPVGSVIVGALVIASVLIHYGGIETAEARR